MIADEITAREFCRSRCDEAAFRRLERYVDLLRKENDRQNLVSKASLDIVWRRHIADGAQLSDYVPRETTWLDLGSGPGLPGVVLAIMRPNDRFTLVESRRKRFQWLSHVAKELDLEHCTIAGTTVEKLGSLTYGAITARAFAPLTKLLHLSARFSTCSTRWLLPKGRSAAQELHEQAAGVREMFHVEQSKTDPEAFILVGSGRPPTS